MSSMKPIIKLVVTVAASFVAFRYVGEFSVPQSGVLAALVWVFYGMLQPLLAVQEEFVPYWVSIQPKWHELLHDYNLINSESEWNEICDKRNSAPATEYSVLRIGITFTMLKPI